MDATRSTSQAQLSVARALLLQRYLNSFKIFGGWRPLKHLRSTRATDDSCKGTTLSQLVQTVHVHATRCKADGAPVSNFVQATCLGKRHKTFKSWSAGIQQSGDMQSQD